MLLHNLWQHSQLKPMPKCPGRIYVLLLSYFHFGLAMHVFALQFKRLKYNGTKKSVQRCLTLNEQRYYIEVLVSKLLFLAWEIGTDTLEAPQHIGIAR